MTRLPVRLILAADQIDSDPDFRAEFFAALDTELERRSAERTAELEAFAAAVKVAAEGLVQARPDSMEVRRVNAATAIPFGVRHLVSPAPTNSEAPVITYSDALQLNVSAEGNPWHAITAEMPETQTETSNGDGSAPGSDSGTDLY
ncbi:putative ATP-grasp-modified RiPP [Streptomyces apocyni]|uniref:putative ATP-grasp-modified RiPP n=1 Tax=Streptomyces apocyni TaxID=2654677 RepID=UPI0012EAE6F7|nr:putative ATP-grasp-modified RiPP [Streptomyces apocyni]